MVWKIIHGQKNYLIIIKSSFDFSQIHMKLFQAISVNFEKIQASSIHGFKDLIMVTDMDEISK